jgi:hypothetical protein
VVSTDHLPLGKTISLVKVALLSDAVSWLRLESSNRERDTGTPVKMAVLRIEPETSF